MIDILSNIPGLDTETAEPFTLEEIEAAEAQEKQDRIAFHAAHVRNGPQSFKTQTNGQARRAQTRDIARGRRKARRNQVQSFFAAQREYATLRAHLQGVGVIAFAGHGKTTRGQMFASARWIAEHFGDLELSGDDLLKDAIQKAYDRYNVLTGQEPTPVEYTS